MADFTKLIAEANAAEQEEAKPVRRANTETEKRSKPSGSNVESIDNRRQQQFVKPTPIEEPVELQSSPLAKVPAFKSNPEEPWTNFTTRLRSGTKKRLHQFCLERQLSNTPPWGQQELVEEAIVALLNKYLAEDDVAK